MSENYSFEFCCFSYSKIKTVNLNLKNMYAKTKTRILTFFANKDLIHLATTDRIRLSEVKKNETVYIIFVYYLQIKSSEFAIILPKTFDIFLFLTLTSFTEVWSFKGLKLLILRLYVYYFH